MSACLVVNVSSTFFFCLVFTFASSVQGLSSGAKVTSKDSIISFTAEDIQLIFAGNNTAFIPSLFQFLANIDQKCDAKVAAAKEELRNEFSQMLQTQVQNILMVEVPKIIDSLVPSFDGSNASTTLGDFLDTLTQEVKNVEGDVEDSMLCQDQGKVLYRDPYTQKLGCQYAFPGPLCPTSVDLSTFPGAVVTICDGNRYQDKCTVICQAGYDAASTKFTCFDGAWKGNLTCKPSACSGTISGVGSQSTHLAAGSCDMPSLPHGNACLLGCSLGYEPAAGSGMGVNCSYGQFVKNGTATCVASLCKTNLTAPINGFVSPKFGKTGDSSTYSCASGYVLEGIAVTQCLTDSTWSSIAPVCTDVNECGANNGGCAQTCTNTNGSFVCSCGSGYSLNANKLSCDDINECTSGTSGCGQNCQNSVGSFSCSCNTGYQLAGDLKSCTALPCTDLVAPANGAVSGTTGVTGTSRTYTCNSGYFLSGATSVTCTAPNWSAVAPTCVSAGGSAAAASTSCAAIKALTGTTTDGLYWINPANPIQTYCDMTLGFTLVMSIHEDNINEKCGPKDRWSSTKGNSASYLSGDGNWQNTNTFGTASAATSDDYKNLLFFTGSWSDLQMWHIPNGTPLASYRSSAFVRYRTNNGFLSSQGGNLKGLFDRNPIISQQNACGTNGYYTPVVWDSDINDFRNNQLPPNTLSELTTGYLQVAVYNNERAVNAFCPVKYNGCGNMEHVCYGGGGYWPEGAPRQCGDFSAFDWDGVGTHSQWSASSALTNAAVLIFAK